MKNTQMIQIEKTQKQTNSHYEHRINDFFVLQKMNLHVENIPQKIACCLQNNFQVSSRVTCFIMSEETNSQDKDITYSESPYRFVIITVYILASLVNGLVNSTFAPIVTVIEHAFGTPKLIITFNYLVYPISHALFSGPVNWCLTKKGLRVSYYIASAAMITGIWLRTTLSQDNPYICLLGSLLCGFGYLFVLNSSSKLTSNWFRSQIMTSMTFLTALASVVSLSLSSILPGVFLTEQSSKEDVIKFFRIQAIMVTIPFILLVIFIRQKPKNPPSKAAAMQEEEDHKDYMYLLKLLFKNKNYLKMAASVALTAGVITAFLGIIDQGLKGLGVKEPAKIISNVVMMVLIFGIIGTVFYSIAVKKTKRYRFFSLVLVFGFFIGYMLLCLIFVFEIEQPWLVSLLSIVFGFNYMAIPPFFIVYGAQIAFPIDQASVAGYLIACLHTFGFVLGVILVALLKQNRFVILTLFLSLGLIIFGGACLATTIHQDLRKDKFEHSRLKKEKLQHFSQQQSQSDSENTSHLIINHEE